MRFSTSPAWKPYARLLRIESLKRNSGRSRAWLNVRSRIPHADPSHDIDQRVFRHAVVENEFRKPPLDTLDPRSRNTAMNVAELTEKRSRETDVLVTLP